MKRIWEFRFCRPMRHYQVESDEINGLLADGWEPFAVDQGVVYLRRSKLVGADVAPV